MSRYIDADHAEFRLQCCGTYHGVIAFDTVKAVLNNAPSIDIVRCAECKYKQQCHKAVEHTTRDTTSVTIAYRPIDFCSYGERREP